MNGNDVLDNLFEEIVENPRWAYGLYPVEGKESEFYITSPDGACWQLTVKEHPHGK